LKTNLRRWKTGKGIVSKTEMVTGFGIALGAANRKIVSSALGAGAGWVFLEIAFPVWRNLTTPFPKSPLPGYRDLVLLMQPVQLIQFQFQFPIPILGTDSEFRDAGTNFGKQNALIYTYDNKTGLTRKKQVGGSQPLVPRIP